MIFEFDHNFISSLVLYSLSLRKGFAVLASYLIGLQLERISESKYFLVNNSSFFSSTCFKDLVYFLHYIGLGTRLKSNIHHS